MNKSKYDRQQKRKAMREAEKEQQREARLKALENKDNNPNGKPYRKIRTLKDGGIAFGKNYKIGRGGLIGISVVTGIMLFLFAGLNGAYDQYLGESTNADKFVNDEFYLPPNDYYIPVINGQEAKDYSGNIIKFKSQEMADEFVKRVTSNDIGLNSFNSIVNFFLHPFLKPMP